MPELRKKILYTLFILLIFRFGSCIPVPFINTDVLSAYFEQSAVAGSMLGYLNMLTGGGLSSATIFAMSITPYINASIILQLLTVAIPALERMVKDGGEEGRKKIASWTRYLAVVLGLLQGFSFYTLLKHGYTVSMLSNDSPLAMAAIVLTFTAGTALIMWLGEHITQNGIGNGISIILFIVFMSNAERRIPVQYAKRVVGRKMYGGQSTHLPIKVSASGVSGDTWLPTLAILMSLTAGTMLLVFIGELITENGIGNGISIILFAGIVSRGPSLISTLFNLFKTGGSGIVSGILMIVIGIAVIVFIVFMSNAERRIPVQYAKRVVGRKMYGGQSTHLPIKVSASGVMPIIFASSILSLPQTISMFWKPEAGTVGYHILNLFSQRSPFYIVLYGLLILAFAYFYASIQFNPIEIANNLKKNGGFIPGFRPGKPTSDFITKALGKVTFVGAIFLAVVAILPLIVGAINPNLSNVALGGTSVIIVVGVALDTVKQMEAQMMMRHHKGFLE